MRIGSRLYRVLLKLYPAGFREDYGAPMQRQFQDDYDGIRGVRARFRFWTATLIDFARSAPGQLAREIGQDTRYAVRMWMKRPLHTAFAVLVLAVAIGANTGVFSVLNAMLLRSLPFQQPERLAALHMFGAPRDTFHDWRRQSAYLADAAIYNSFEVNLDGLNVARRVRLTETSWNFFSLLGREPVRGRSFLPGEDVPGHGQVAVLAHHLWQEMLGTDPRAVGATVRLNGTPLTVVGVAPADLDFPLKTDVWTPTTFDYQRIQKSNTPLFWFTIGRLKPDLTWTQARKAFEIEAYAASPERRTADAINRPALVPLQETLAGPVRSASLVLMGGVALLLLLACANIANLLLARTIARSQELAIRRALGASQARLTQQLLTETLLLSLAATLAGVLVARWTAGILAAVQPVTLAVQSYSILDWRVLGFAVALSGGTGLIFGVGPALYASRMSFGGTNRAGTPARRHTQARSALVVMQMALTIVLVTGSIALGGAFLRLLRTDNGYDLASIATLRVSLAGTPYLTNEQARGYLTDVTRRVGDLPGVTAVSATESLPLAVDAFMGGGFGLDDGPSAGFTAVGFVAPGFFRTMGGAVLAGREFSADDLETNEPVVLVNDTFARGFGDPASVVGESVTGKPWPAARVVGVVRSMRFAGPTYPPTPQIFWPSRGPRALTFVVHVEGRARDRIARIRDTVQAVDARVPAFDVMTMDQRLDATLARPKFHAMAVLFFGGLALLLAIIGVYGVVSYAVVQRTREMGIRLALGTTPRRLRALLVGRMSITLAAGGAAGILIAAAFGRYLQTMVHGASAETLGTSTLAVAITASVGAAAAWLATRRIARLDITDVLRIESAD